MDLPNEHTADQASPTERVFSKLAIRADCTSQTRLVYLLYGVLNYNYVRQNVLFYCLVNSYCIAIQRNSFDF